ncbi:MAG TPA: hypothetical protein VNA87_04965 [Actinomycetota bacterium]|nr:hypothetical protein [Actinomycetota bacterium]
MPTKLAAAAKEIPSHLENSPIPDPSATPVRLPEGGSKASASLSPGSATRTLVVIDDAHADHGSGPAYADIRKLVLQDLGTSARLILEFGEDLPPKIPEQEVMGVGVDFFFTGASESDYQVFLDGGPNGWFAHFQTPQGYAQFPGTLTLGGNRAIVELDWGALGGASSGTISNFVDWSKEGLIINEVSRDFISGAGFRR